MGSKEYKRSLHQLVGCVFGALYDQHCSNGEETKQDNAVSRRVQDLSNVQFLNRNEVIG